MCCSASYPPFENIKAAIKCEDRETLQCLLEELQKRILEDETMQKVPSLLEEDELATAFLPNDIPEKDVFPAKSTGDGNCLFHSASLYIRGIIYFHF